MLNLIFLDEITVNRIYVATKNVPVDMYVSRVLWH